MRDSDQPYDAVSELDEMLQRALDAIEELAREGVKTSEELIALYEREAKLLEGIRKRQEIIEQLKFEKSNLMGELSATQRRYKTLQNAPLVKVQRKYWQLNKRLRGGGSQREGDK